MPFSPGLQVVLALITAVLAVATPALNAAANLLNRESRTSVTFLGATESVITISATNTGRRASLLREFTLHFEGTGLEPIELELDRTEAGTVNNVVMPGQTVRVPLIAFTGPAKATLDLGNAKAFIEAGVQESDVKDSGQLRRCRTETFRARQLETFVLHHTAR